ncbi:CPBP family intramembrane glutamic endopeptidase [Psychrobacter sp. I-STPA10]|uniref:CPBP family intramembrane glutamic endopeptidase n=1 Tax=Psychrobacter sp. I-STPA10 TaxID=2585769 RepID=UPI003FA6ABEB
MMITLIGVFWCLQVIGLYVAAWLVFPYTHVLSFSQAIQLGSLNGTVTALSICFVGVAMLCVSIGWVAWQRYVVTKKLLTVPHHSDDSVAMVDRVVEKADALTVPTIRQYLAIQGFNLSTAIGMLGVLLLFVFASEGLTYYLGEDPTEFLRLIYDTAYPRWLIIFAMVVVAPIYEELMFRGLIWSALREQLSGIQGVWFASIISSVLFAVIHLQYGLYEISTIMVLAMIFCLARVKSGSLLLPMLLHIINNGLAMWQFIAVNGY